MDVVWASVMCPLLLAARRWPGACRLLPVEPGAVQDQILHQGPQAGQAHPPGWAPTVEFHLQSVELSLSLWEQLPSRELLAVR
jgi:hypothetical protein